MNNRTPILKLKSIERTFVTPAGDIPVLHHIDLEVFPGDFIALTGPSGSGKTTLLNMASLLDLPTSGSIIFDQHDVTRIPLARLAQLRQEKIGMVFQRFHLLTRRTALDNVFFRFRYSSTPRIQARKLARRALNTVGLEHIASRQARLLSGGEMQRVAIARAIANPPLVLFADEPTGNLDSDSASIIMDVFKQINDQGMAIILATHNRALLSYCTRHIICRDGTLHEEELRHA